MAGMMSGNDDFSWNDSTIFDKIGNQATREEFLQDLSGTGNNEREVNDTQSRNGFRIDDYVHGNIFVSFTTRGY